MNTLPMKDLVSPRTFEEQAENSALPENLYLFDERNRAFLEYRSAEIYPRRNPAVDAVLRAIIPAGAILLAVFLLLSWLNATRQGIEARNTSLVTLAASVLFGSLVILVIVSIPVLYYTSLRKSAREREALIRDGNVIFTPVEKCTLTRFYWRGPHIHEPAMRIRYSFVSPRSGRTLTRSFTTAWPADSACIAPGTPIAVLFLNYKSYQVL